MIVANTGSIASNPSLLQEAMGVICRNMMALNPCTEIVYRPYTHPVFVERRLHGSISIDLAPLFPQAKPGDSAYIEISLWSQCDSMSTITIIGAKAMYINGVFKPCAPGKNLIPCALKKGANSLIFQCVKTDDAFAAQYMVSYPAYTFNWTCDYILWTRDTSPVEEYAGEQGFSVSELMHDGAEKQPADCALVYPAASQPDDTVDLSRLYGACKGKYAFSYAHVKADGTLAITGDAKTVSVYVNGQKQDALTVSVRHGDVIFIVSERNDAFWGFTCASTELLHLPFVCSSRQNGTHFLHIGAFNSPELPSFSLTTPYVNADGEATFWRFTEGNVYLRPYLDTSFFGQWFYGLMVAENGLLNASKYAPELYDYFEKSMTILVSYYRYMQYDARLFGDSTFLKRSVRTADLDSIGTIGMNLYEFYIRAQDAALKAEIRYVMERLAESVFTKIPRLEDGTFCRTTVMWADDTYMSCPFLVRMGNLTGDAKYYDEVARQFRNYTQRMFMEDQGIFAHIYYVGEQRNNRVPWGRGNGWVYLSFAEVLEHLPKDYPGREELEAIWVRAVEGLIAYQGESGRWHQVLNMPASYEETSCTAIFTMAIGKGIKLGLLEKGKYLPVMQKAVEGLLRYSVDESGNVSGVCRGSGCCDDANYYATLGTVLNDAHGTGVVVSAICAVLDLLD